VNSTVFEPFILTVPFLLGPMTPPCSPPFCSLDSTWMNSGTMALISVELTKFPFVLTLPQLPCCLVLSSFHCTWFSF
jgi:hypothetical protein